MEIESKLKSITSQNGVKGYLILNSDGQKIKTNLETDLSDKYQKFIYSMMAQVNTFFKQVSENPSNAEGTNDNDLKLMRFRSSYDDVIIAPDGDFTMVILKEPQS